MGSEGWGRSSQWVGTVYGFRSQCLSWLESVAGYLHVFIGNCQLVGSPNRTILIAGNRRASPASHLNEIPWFQPVALVRQVFPVPISGDLSSETKNREVVGCATL